MKITGYRTLTTAQHWGRPVGDVNGFISEGVTEVPVVIIETDGGIEGVGVGSHVDIDRVFPALEGQDPRATVALYDRMLAQVFKSGHTRRHVRRHRRLGHGAVGPQGQDGRRAALAHPGRA